MLQQENNYNKQYASNNQGGSALDDYAELFNKEMERKPTYLKLDIGKKQVSSLALMKKARYRPGVDTSQI